MLIKRHYETETLIGFVHPYMGQCVVFLEGLIEKPPEEAPGWHSSELETSQDMAYDPDLVRMERAYPEMAHIPSFLPKSFQKNDGMPDVEFEGYQYFTFPMDHHDFVESGTIGNLMRATMEKGEEAFRRLTEPTAKAVLELTKVPVTVTYRVFVDRFKL